MPTTPTIEAGAIGSGGEGGYGRPATRTEVLQKVPLGTGTHAGSETDPAILSAAAVMVAGLAVGKRKP